MSGYLTLSFSKYTSGSLTGLLAKTPLSYWKFDRGAHVTRNYRLLLQSKQLHSTDVITDHRR